jgi:hypothetical protein
MDEAMVAAEVDRVVDGEREAFGSCGMNTAASKRASDVRRITSRYGDLGWRGGSASVMQPDSVEDWTGLDWISIYMYKGW